MFIAQSWPNLLKTICHFKHVKHDNPRVIKKFTLYYVTGNN